MDLTAACRKDLEAELRACISDGPTPLFDIVRYHLGWLDERGCDVSLPGGKMLRPILCLLSCHGVGGDYRGALPAAAAIEMVHNFSLIHDDVQDRSPQRRHRPTVWSLWGDAQAINAGDGLHVLAHLANMRLLERGVPPEKTLATLRELDQASLELCEGQYLDISFEQEARVSLQSYLMMIGKKTAALFAASARIGAILGAGAGDTVEGLGRFGEEIGLSFQIQDDILGIWGIEKETGKPSLDDIRAKKKSLPIVHAMSSAQPHSLRILDHAFARGDVSDEKLSAVLDILDDAGSRDYCDGIAREYWDRAWSRLNGLKLESTAEEALRRLASELVARAA
ncbi:MAG: polyprenyl synthetase family protein [Dehalococcoidia bacterium]|nr:polyprenyl synthetase family protein [Dehalococcoidia bacterium]